MPVSVQGYGCCNLTDCADWHPANAARSTKFRLTPAFNCFDYILTILQFFVHSKKHFIKLFERKLLWCIAP
jgi:hypothetical protein